MLMTANRLESAIHGCIFDFRSGRFRVAFVFKSFYPVLALLTLHVLVIYWTYWLLKADVAR